MLHIIKRQQAIVAAQQQFESKDSILLIEDAVYLANPNHYLHPLIAGCKGLSVLEPDVQARGLSHLVSVDIDQVDYAGFVALTECYSQSLTWD
jgi:tRNA 2-thiouridine synthesizing protein B